MTMTDPIADMLTRIRNANAMKSNKVAMPHSNMKVHIAEILKEEGFIKDYEVTGVNASSDKLPRVLNGLGIAIISTSQGVMTDKKARKLGIGGEVIAYVW